MFRSLMPFGQSGLSDPFTSLQREINRLFEDTFRMAPAWTTSGKASLSPSVDVKETEKAVEITAELPGIDEKDVQVTFDNDVLILKGEKKTDITESKEGYRMSERSYGSFERAWQIPDVDGEKISATFAKGVLTISLPKRAGAKPAAKKIPVRAAA